MDRQPQTPPLFYRTVEANEVFHPSPQREGSFPEGAIKIDEEELISCHKNIFELEVAVEEPQLVEFSKEKSGGSDHFSFRRDVFSGWVGPDFPKILNQVPGIGDFDRE